MHNYIKNNLLRLFLKDFLDRSEIINVLTGFNPWWSERHYLPSVSASGL